MQDPPLYPQIQPQNMQFPEQEHLKCPRCDSTDTKFCYFNNYNLSQPRHFCKSCRRYWTKGGTLRNVPVGGGSRKKTKRSSIAAVQKASVTPAPAADDKSEDKNAPAVVAEAIPPVVEGDNSTVRFENSTEGSDSDRFCSLLGPCAGQFGNYLDGLGLNRPNMAHFSDPGPGHNVDPFGMENVGGNSNADGFLGIHDGGDSDCWGGASAMWPDLAM